MWNPVRALVLTFAVLAFLPACKKVRTERWEKGGGDPLSAKFVGQSMDRWNGSQQHSMGNKRIETEDLFGGKRDNSQFGAKRFRSKRFLGGDEKFAGSKDYRRDEYQFVKDREMARDAAASAGKQFAPAGKTAYEGRKRWFGRDKKIEKKAVYGADKTVGRPLLHEAAASQERNGKTELDIINSAGTAAAPKAMSIDEVRKLLRN